MASVNPKNPPGFGESTTFEQWELLVELWQAVTDLKPEKQGPALVLALTKKAREAALEIPMIEIKGSNGVEKILEKLGKIYKKDKIDTAYEAFESFIYFKRTQDMKMLEFITEFERRLAKAKAHGCELSSNVLAFFLLNQAQLEEEKKQLIKATITTLEYEEMKTKLSKVFGASNSKNYSEEINVKTEELCIAEEEEAFYGSYNYRPGFRGRRATQFSGRGKSNFRQPGYQYRGRGYSRGGFFPGKKIKCNICESIMHLARDCPDKIYFQEQDFGQEEELEEEEHNIVLYQSNLVTEQEFKTFVAEASVSAILDSGASANVAGKVWFTNYLASLSTADHKSITKQKSSSNFKFGSGTRYKSLYKAEVPAWIGDRKIRICTDVVEADVPLLLSKDAMKRAGTEINFVTDSVVMFGEEQKVTVTQSGHYAIPLNKAGQLLEDIDKKNIKITLIAENMDKKKMALKLHSQFAHAPKVKLVSLLSRAGRGDDKELIKSIEEVQKTCKICNEYAKPTPRPVVGLSHASAFNETVAMDLFSFRGKIILHLIDHLTRFSVAYLCNSKEPKEIIKAIFLAWISIFGAPSKFLFDNGGEFANERMKELGERMNIRLMHTAAESPWSNGLVERHNATLKDMLERIMAEGDVTLPVALAWASQAKNALANVHGFSPAQLTFGQNPPLPSVLSDKPPALESDEGKDVIAEHLLALRSARQAFMKAESAEKVKRAVRHNIRPSAKHRFFQGDIVYYKRNDCKKWRGPGRVIGMESSTVLIKHGNQYVKVHVCRVLPDKTQNLVDEKVPQISAEAPDKSQEDHCEKLIEEHPSQGSEDQNEEADKKEEEEEPVQNGSSLETADREDENYESAVEDNGDDNDPCCGLELAGSQQIKRSVGELKKGMNISFIDNKGDRHEGVVMRRTGKLGKNKQGKFKDYWEVKDVETGVSQEYNTAEDWKYWKLEDEQITDKQEEGNEIFMSEASVKEHTAQKIKEAKDAEVGKWIEEKVYEEVDYQGQDLVNTTWVITQKLKDGETITKARLVVRGYEEEEKSRADSPTCNKNNIRSLLALAVSKDWVIHALDVKAAFLQGKPIDRLLYVNPPKDYRKAGVVWKLNKVVYGLTDAARNWYLRVYEVFESLGMWKCELDNAVFCYGSKELKGVAMIHVDDILYFGSGEFHRSVMSKFRECFKISKEEKEAFKYVGIVLSQVPDGILFSQEGYLNTVTPQILEKSHLKDSLRYATEEERKKFRRGVGQLGWLANTSRPEGSFSYCLLSTVQSNPQVKDFKLLEKTIKGLNSTDGYIKIRKMSLGDLRLAVFCDASYGNLTGGSSQIGYIIFLHDASLSAVPVTWMSKKAARVARSTLTAETLAAIEAVDAAYAMKRFIETVFMCKLPPIDVYVDNKSLYDSVQTTNSLAEKRLMVDMAALREMVEKKEICMHWVPTDKQLADVLTKQGVNKEKLVNALVSGKINLYDI